MYLNHIYQDNKGELYISLYSAEQTETKETYIVYFKVDDKSKVLVTPQEEFLKKFRHRNPHDL